ncbi:MAG: hypothetical protein GXP40_07245 [Chloroflexi bacterium]|nr:hypothetical protein [Chloroflexota bacterium]
MQIPKPKTLYILAAAILWGTTGTARAVGLVHVSLLAVGVMRMLIGGLTLLLFSLLSSAGSALLKANSPGVDMGAGVRVGAAATIGAAAILVGVAVAVGVDVAAATAGGRALAPATAIFP